MIFLGDIASPTTEHSEILAQSLKENARLFQDQISVANLEGLLADISTQSDTPVLFNHPSILDALKFANVKALSLANNHTLDLPLLFENTTSSLDRNNITFFGAGQSNQKAFEPQYFSAEGYEFTIIGACWHVMLQHQKNPDKGVYVATIKEQKIIDIIKREKEKHPNRKILFLPHWNLDLEKIPFPIHRTFARACIDAGASAVIGNHSHCIQGGERYKEGFIIYGLGNFYIPWKTFINGTIHFPEFSKTSLALEWCLKTNNLTCHYFEYNEKDHKLKLIVSEDFDTGKLIDSYTPYKNMSSAEYVKWYKKNRRKGFLIPTYVDYRNTFQNTLFDWFLITRIKFARLLAKTGLRKWNN